jgi:FdhD protein|tara:strand:- start:830 stop:1711 length:882 start_codon:yes stop_codon:yes gene_type:complete
LSTRIKKIDNTNYIIKDWDMKIKQKNSKMILPKLKMKDLIFSEKVINENKESQNIALIDEKILTIYLNKQEILSAMTICDYPEYLAVGFLFNQNMISSLSEITEVEFNEELSVVVVRTSKPTPFETNNQKRIKTSGCAMGTIFGEMFEKIMPLSSEKLNAFSLKKIRAIVKEINQTPSLYLEAGAIHGSVLCDSEGLLVYMEDVGRHNAVDKVSGFIVMEAVDPTDKFLYTTGRLTTEMVLKTVSMGVPLLISRSGFTKSAVELARKFNLTMVGRFRGNRFMCVSGFERIVLD